MNKTVISLLVLVLIAGCKEKKTETHRIPVAEVGKTVLYYDEIPDVIQDGATKEDSTALIQNYVNRWAKRKLLLQKAEDNLSADLKEEVNKQLEETRANLLIYQYQRQIMLEKMDTVLSETELESYYVSNERAFILTSNIVKALFIKLPADTPELSRIRSLARSNNDADLRDLQNICMKFAEKFDDFNQEWVPMNRLSVELPEDVINEEDFLRRNTFYETSDAGSVYMISVKDYRLRSSLAPFEYVKNDIRRIILNTRRIDLFQSLENGIYNDALKDNSFKIY
jgi:hypothetical protein